MGRLPAARSVRAAYMAAESAPHWTQEFSRVAGWSQCAPIFFLKHQKENGRTRSKEKMFRRVGPHTCGPPAAGGGRLALPRGNQGRKRAALGVIQARGSPGYLPLRFYPQGVRRISPQGGRDIRSAAKPRTAVQRKAAEPRTAAQSLPLAFPCGARADTQVGPYKTLAVSCSLVGADLRVHPPERSLCGTVSGSGFRSRGHASTIPVFLRTRYAAQGWRK